MISRPMLSLGLKRLLESSAVRASIGFGLGGLAFSVANVLLAKFVDSEEFGLFSLALALNQLGMSLGPAGLEIVVARHRPPVQASLARHVLGTSSLVAAVTAAAAVHVYRIDVGLSLVLAVTIIASSTSRVASAFFQAEQRFGTSLSLSQVHNFLLLAFAGIAYYTQQRTAEFLITLVATAYISVGLVGWLAARLRLPGDRPSLEPREMRKEGFAAVGIGTASLIMMQAERLAIPVLLSLETMATYAVLAAVVGAPFRVMQMAVGYTMLPRLRAAPSLAAARRLLRSELKVSSAVCLAGTLAVLVLIPVVMDGFLQGKYPIGSDLVIATLLVGYVKTWQGFAVSSLTALGRPRALSTMTLFSWASLGVAAGAMWLLRSWGLTGIVSGAGVGWGFQAAAATWLAVQAARTHWSSGAQSSYS